MNRQHALGWLKAAALIGVYGGLLMPVMFIPIVIFPFVFSKLIFFQVLIGLTFPAYLALAWAEPRYRPPSSLLYIAIAAYFVALGLSVIFSVDPMRSWWGNQERMNGLFTLLHFFAWLTMAIGILKTWPQWRRLLKFEIGLSVFMAVVAILEKPFPNLLMFPAGDRVGGLLDNPIYMGAYQIFNLFFIALLWMKGSTRNAKIWYAIAAVVDLTAFILAQSRGDLVGVGCGIIAFALAYGIMTENRKTKRILLGTVIACFAAYGLLFALRNVPLIQHSPLERFTNLNTTIDTRLIAWKISWEGFLERPLTGWGLDVYHVLFNLKYNPQSLRHGYYETWFDRSHNTVLDILSMTGVFGFVTYAAIYLSLFWLIIQARRKRWMNVPMTSILLSLPVAYFVQNLFVFDHPAAFSMSYLMFGLVIAATSSRFAEEGTSASSGSVPVSASRPIPWVAFGVGQLTFVVLVWTTSIVPFHISMISIRSNNAFSARNYALAYQLAKDAAVPWTPYLDEQTFLQSRNFIALSAVQLQSLSFAHDWHDLIVSISEKQIAQHPRNTNPVFIYARFLETMESFVPQDGPKAEAEYKAAIALSPKRQQLLFGYARFLINHNRQDEALSVLQQTVAEDDQIGEAHWMLGLHYFFDRHDTAKGAAEMIQAIKVPYPYTLQSVQEALALSYAYDTTNDKDGLKSIMSMLPTLPQGDLTVYLHIASVMEHQGMIPERNMILNALVSIDPSLAKRLAPLSNGSATSIQASLEQTQASANVSSTSLPAETSGTTTSRTSGSGPRR